MSLKKTLIAVAIASSSLVSISSHATPMIYLNDNNGAELLIQDQDGNDGLDLEGGVSYVGSIGDWFVTSHTGVSKPILGDASSPEMDLVSLSISSLPGQYTSTPLTLSVTFFDDGFTSPGGVQQFMSNIGGTADGMINWSTCVYDKSASPFDNCNDVDEGSFTASPGSDAAFSFSNSGYFDFTGFDSDTYGIAMTANITHDGNRTYNTSFDYSVKVPEPSSMALFGLGLLGLFSCRNKAIS